jgi:hypothetical protein
MYVNKGVVKAITCFETLTSNFSGSFDSIDKQAFFFFFFFSPSDNFNVNVCWYILLMSSGE